MTTDVATERSSPVVVDTRRSARARLQPIPITAVRLSDTIWEPRRQRNAAVTVPAQHQLLERTARLDNFRRSAAGDTAPSVGMYFNDTDVYKWLEAASWVLATDPDPDLDALVDEVIATVGAAQLDDGYLDTFYTLGGPETFAKRWTELTRTHELYCAGHLIQAAVAHYRATGKTSLLTIATRFADLLVETFGPPEDGKRPGTDGHEEIELALVELARATGDQRYVALAAYFLDARGYGLVGGDEYHQDHLPFREMDTIVGHAVRAVYLTTGATDIYTETGDETILTAIHRLWHNMVHRRMYVSGGIGARWEGEAFGRDFELPNARAYTETCAAIGSVMWNWRLLALTGEAQYADLIETTLYNAILPGLSLSGDEFFYQNPLSDDGEHRREPWFEVACCPPNIARTLASIGGYVASTSADGVWVHLYADSAIDATLPTGTAVRLRQRTEYPWAERVVLEVDASERFTLYLRIPAWCDAAGLSVNGDEIDGPIRAGTYVEIDRSWRPGDVVTLDLPMPVRFVAAHPHVFELTGRGAVFRGPILYCVEGADNPGIDPRDVLVSPRAEASARHEADLLGGVTVIHLAAHVAPPRSEWASVLYRPLLDGSPLASPTAATVTLIPYHVWANRDPGRMEVWLRTDTN